MGGAEGKVAYIGIYIHIASGCQVADIVQTPRELSVLRGFRRLPSVLVVNTSTFSCVLRSRVDL